MKTTKIITAVSAFILIVFMTISCNKTVPNTTLNIVTPLGNQTYAHSDTVHVIGTITSDLKMYGYTVRIKSINTTTNVVFEKKYTTEGNSYSIDESWINNVPVNSTMKLEIDNLNKKGNVVGTYEMGFLCSQ